MRIALVLMVTASLAASAAADEVAGTLGGDKLVEVARDVAVTGIDGLSATVVETRRFKNGGPAADELVLDAELASGVVTSLRVKTGAAWVEGKVGPLADLRKLYEAHVAPGTAEPRLVAVALRVEGGMRIQAFPVAPGGEVTVEYTVRHSFATTDGAFEFSIPWVDHKGAKPAVKVTAPGATHTAKETADELEVTVRKPIAGPAFARLATTRLEGGRTAWRVEVLAAAELGALPKAPRVVFVVDASRSVGDKGLAAQLALVTAYVNQVPDATVEIVAFRRQADRLFDSFVAASELPSLLSLGRARLNLGNGSHLEAGLALAAQALGSSKGGPPRIVVVSDLVMRTAFTPQLAQAALAKAPAGTIVHFVDVMPSIARLTDARNRTSPLAAVAERTGGMVLDVRGDPANGPVEAVARGLVRPVRLDEVAVAEWKELSLPPRMEQGTGLVRVGIGPLPARPRFRAYVWGRAVDLALTPDGAAERVLPALLLETRPTGITEAEVRGLALRATALTELTALLAAEAGAAASKGGLSKRPADNEGWGRGIGTGYGTIGGVPHNTISGNNDRLGTLILLLRQKVQPCTTKAPLKLGKVVVETTPDEISDVRIEGITGETATCVTEAIWETVLPPGKYILPSEQFALELSRLNAGP
jgi:hypothetical protein